MSAPLKIPPTLTIDFETKAVFHTSPQPPRKTYPTPVQYRRHNCTRQHRSPVTMAKCIWRRRVWLYGTGRFACVAYCGRGTTIQLSETVEEARIWLAQIDYLGCGGFCSKSRHRLVELIP